jgi:hypothetical protein
VERSLPSSLLDQPAYRLPNVGVQGLRGHGEHDRLHCPTPTHGEAATQGGIRRRQAPQYTRMQRPHGVPVRAIARSHSVTGPKNRPILPDAAGGARLVPPEVPGSQSTVTQATTGCSNDGVNSRRSMGWCTPSCSRCEGTNGGGKR